MSPSTKSNSARFPSARATGRVDLFPADINLPGVLEIGSYHHRAAHHELRSVAHAGCCGICFLSRGVQTYRIADQLFHLQGGDQLVTLPDDILDTAEAREEKGRLHWLLLRMQPLDAPLLFLQQSAARELRRALLAMPAQHFPAPPGTNELTSAILNTFARPPRTLLARLAAASLVLRYVFATLQAAHHGTATAISPRIQRSLDYLTAQVAEPLYVPALARQIGLSESRFKVRFRREVGLPPGEFILRAKINAACMRLRDPAVAVTAIAHELGFSSSQYFATTFRRFTGLTPSAYQARSRSPAK
ncbi:MAG: helix-turn-helix transcriptional regulator [Opitutaceae bacterium]|jgi:AraC-like DNA-binding protein|nr:helix-turn-helix transcriptional regulator [Opitutaceae bacterium]MBP9914403.1 helix-turn-helix transcriptional regulator [Opitutaceae bacterium]